MQIKIVNLLIMLSLAAAQNQRPKNCLEIRDASENAVSGEYIIYPLGSPMRVWCDMTSGGGGWTVFHRRFDGSIDFYRNWDDYKQGFGNVNGGEFWLGNDNIHALTSSDLMELRVDLQSHTEQKFAEYSIFSLADERNKYQLNVRGYKNHSTVIDDSLTRFHNLKPYTTFDNDNDNLISNSAVLYKGAWWYYSVHTSNLNGMYEYTPENQGDVRHSSAFGTCMFWTQFDDNGSGTSLKAASMKVRPVGSTSPSTNENECKVKDGESFPFGACSVTCGEGVKARVFFCTFPGNGTRRTIREEVKCDAGTPCTGNK